jgi:hypothetical protein
MNPYSSSVSHSSYRLGCLCQAWHWQQAPWRADDWLGMKTSIHDSIKSLAPERDRFAPGLRHHRQRESRYGEESLQCGLCSLHLARQAQRPACASEILAGSWLGALGTAEGTPGQCPPTPSPVRDGHTQTQGNVRMKLEPPHPTTPNSFNCLFLFPCSFPNAHHKAGYKGIIGHDTEHSFFLFLNFLG